MASLIMRWTIPVLLLGAALAGAWENSARRRIEEELHAGTLDTATALRLQEILSDPVASPDGIPGDLLRQIPDLDAACAQRLRQLDRRSLQGDTLESVLGSACHEAVAEYLKAGGKDRTSGAFSVRSSSLIDTVPQWKRDLQGQQRIGPFQARLHWSPDRSSPWVFRQLAVTTGASRLLVGDLQGWREAEELWNRPGGKAAADRSFLAGSGAWINGAQVDVHGDALELRAAVHRRDSAVALAAGLGGFGQFLSVASGQDSGRRWLGTQLSASLCLEDAMISLQPAWSRSRDLDDRSVRLDASGRTGLVAWKAWGGWRDDEFSHPMAPFPRNALGLGADGSSPVRSGGLSVDGRDSLLQWHASATVAADARDRALTESVLRAVHAADRLFLEASAKSAILSRPDTAPARSWQFLQSARSTWGDWTPRLRLQEELDTAGAAVAATPGLVWKPLRQWSLEAWVRQSLDSPSRRESSVSTRLSPVRRAEVVTEVLWRQGMLRTGQERWYVRLEGSSRW